MQAHYNRPECKYKNNKCAPPTYKQVRSMSWIAIAGGANGLFFYSFFRFAAGRQSGFNGGGRVVAGACTSGGGGATVCADSAFES